MATWNATEGASHHGAQTGWLVMVWNGTRYVRADWYESRYEAEQASGYSRFRAPAGYETHVKPSFARCRCPECEAR